MQLRTAWRDLVDNRLPRAALTPSRNWPVHLNHCFARILLDNACGMPWRKMIQPPAWKNTPANILKEAIDLGEAVLSGDANLAELNNRSLIMRGKAFRRTSNHQT